MIEAFVPKISVKQSLQKTAMEAPLTMQLVSTGRSPQANTLLNILQHTDQFIINNSDSGPLLKVWAARPTEILHERQPDLQSAPTTQWEYNGLLLKPKLGLHHREVLMANN